jgi:hypothetical protein
MGTNERRVTLWALIGRGAGNVVLRSGEHYYDGSRYTAITRDDQLRFCAYWTEEEMERFGVATSRERALDLALEKWKGRADDRREFLEQAEDALDSINMLATQEPTP